MEFKIENAKDYVLSDYVIGKIINKSDYVTTLGDYLHMLVEQLFESVTYDKRVRALAFKQYLNSNDISEYYVLVDYSGGEFIPLNENQALNYLD